MQKRITSTFIFVNAISVNSIAFKLFWDIVYLAGLFLPCINKSDDDDDDD